MLELILVRHGETDSNIRGTYCGWTDAPLNDKGLNQACETARKLKDVRFDAVFCSPLARAVQTAKIVVGNRKCEITLAEALKEHNFGIWEDLTHAEITERYPEEAAAWENDWMNYEIEGGESAVQGFRRVSGFVDGLINRYGNGTILLVSHLGSIRYILVHLLGLPIDYIWRFGADNGSITRVVIPDDRYAWLKNLNI